MTAARICLNFHGIGRPARTLEPGEAPYWISAERFGAILDRVATLPDPDRIHITFDDGNASDHDIALPALVARGLRADVFVLTGRIGQPGSLDQAQIRALIAAGFGIGSHGIAHRDWRRIAPDELRHELVASKAALDAICGEPVTEAAIPFGSYNGRVLDAIRAAGYACAWTSDRGGMDPGAFLRPRTSIRNDQTDADIAAILAGQMALKARLRRAIGMARRRRARD